MKIWKKIKMMRGRPLIDIWHYIIGNFRYNLYYSEGCWKKEILSSGRIVNIQVKNPFMRKHIYEQINYRIKWMDKECYDNGSCKICGCETTALQMCNKSCEKPCYPSMMNKKQWEVFKKGSTYTDKHGKWMPTFTEGDEFGRPILLKETPYSYVQDN